MITSEIDKYIIGRVEPQIYAFSTETVPNYLKVGDTYRPVEQRLKEWKKYFPDLKEHLEAVAKVDDETYFRDYAIHFYLEHDLAKHRLMPTNIKDLPYYSREFFKETSDVDVTQAITDIRLDFAQNKGKYQFYTFDERPTAITYTYKRGDKELPLRPNQEETVKNFTTAVNSGRTNLLMYAVMRFGKTFTALSCAKTDPRFKAILVVSGKADVKEAWKKTTESIKNFEGFDFIDSDALARNNNVVDETIKKGHRAVVFLTLQDLSGGQIKEKHKHIFERQWNLLIVDETHYGARAEEYGKVLRIDRKKEIETEFKYTETAEDYDNNEDLKRLHSDVRLHLSGTPYRILMGSEFKREDIIAFYQFSDIVRDKEAWDAEHLNEDDCNEWDNPYFGFPQMVRFAFNVNESSMRKMEELKKSGIEYALNELLRPMSTLKENDGRHLKFMHEKEVLDLLMAIDGSKNDNNILSFLDYDRIKQGKMCRHVVFVLPYRASCDAMETLIKKNKALFKNLGQYEILNIAGVGDGNKYPRISDITDKITDCEQSDIKTITLTVNRMLTGTTVPEWDTMVYLKDTVSPQEYDQATFRLQSQYIREMKDSKGDVVKYNMKPQTLLVDFEPGRMFRMQEAKSQIYNVNTDKRGNNKLSSRIEEELRISPIIVVNKDRMQEVRPKDILDAVQQYSASKSIRDEARGINVDDGLLERNDILDALKPLRPIDTKRGLFDRAYEGDGDDLDTGGDSTLTCNKKPTSKETKKEKDSGETANEKDVLRKKLQTYYSFILFFAFLTDDKVDSLEDIINVIGNNDDNKRIAKNIGVSIDILKVIQSAANTFILRDLDYKISHISQLSHDTSVEPTEKAERAMRQFGKLSDSEIITPSWMADEMVDFLPEEKIKQDTRILDIAAKEGEFAIALYKKYGDKVKNTVYSLPTSPLTYEFTRKVYSFLDMPIENVMRDYTSFDLIRPKTKDKLMKIIKEEIDPTVIISNPPYQDTAVGEQKTFNGPIYNLFIDSAYNVSGVVEMIHPARFLTNAGSTPKKWNRQMLDDPYFSIKDYREKSDAVFDDTDIKGGVAVSLHDKDSKHKPVGIFTRYPELNSILLKVTESKDFKPMSDIVVTRTAYRFTDIMHEEHPEAMSQLSNGHPYDVSTNIFERLPQVFYDEKPNDGKDYIQILGRMNNERTYKYVRRDYIRPVSNLDNYKVFLSKANGTGEYGEVLTPPFIGEPGIGNTETFISIGKFNTEYEAEAAIKYIDTRFARALLGALKTTQDITPEKWAYVPLQNFTVISDIDWNLPVDDIDNLLFKKYNLTATEQNFIRSKVKKMEYRPPKE